MSSSRVEHDEAEEYDLDSIIEIIDEMAYDNNNPEFVRKEIAGNSSGSLDIDAEVGKIAQSVVRGPEIVTDRPKKLDVMIEDYRRQFNAIINEFEAGRQDSLDTIITEYRSDFEGIIKELENSEDSLHIFPTIADAQRFFFPVDINRDPQYSPTSPFHSPKSPTYSPSSPHYFPLSSIYPLKSLCWPNPQEYSPAAPFDLPISPFGPKYSPSSPLYHPVAPIAPIARMYSHKSPNASSYHSSITAINADDENLELSHRGTYTTNDQDHLPSLNLYAEQAHIYSEFPLMDAFLQVVRAGLAYVKKTSEDLLESEQDQTLLALKSSELQELSSTRQTFVRQSRGLQQPAIADGYSQGLYAGGDPQIRSPDTKGIPPTPTTVVSSLPLEPTTMPLVAETGGTSKDSCSPQELEISVSTNKQISPFPLSPSLSSPLSPISSFAESPTAISPRTSQHVDTAETTQGDGIYTTLEIQGVVENTISPKSSRVATQKEGLNKSELRRSSRIAALKCTRQAAVSHDKQSEKKDTGKGIQKRKRGPQVVTP
ncbi:hypothetical protein B7494_g5168 [Chlorociboria aeruginascens]|nr:hypothetical protein B7494_g5168 [Chlorociboria aeruginascens]